jgi:hypothetical protein
MSDFKPGDRILGRSRLICCGLPGVCADKPGFAILKSGFCISVDETPGIVFSFFNQSPNENLGGEENGSNEGKNQD